MGAPYVIQQEAIFGYYQRYTRNVVAQSDVSLFTIDKEEVLQLLEDFLVFRLNMVNHCATQTQKLSQQLWRGAPQSLRERLIRFLIAHCCWFQDFLHLDGTSGTGVERQSSECVACAEPVAV